MGAFSERWGRTAKTVSRTGAWGPRGCRKQAGLPARARVLLPPSRQRGWKALPTLTLTTEGWLSGGGGMVRCGWVHTLQGWGKDLAQF